jgi:methyl-accepting chemotaxis protein
VDRATQQNAALVEESSAAADSLRDQATALASVVAGFRLQ